MGGHGQATNYATAYWSLKAVYDEQQADFRKLVERMESLPNATQQTLEWAEEIRKVLDRGSE